MKPKDVHPKLPTDTGDSKTLPQGDTEYVEGHIKILLLGTSDSGKTTLGRQIRILHGEPFNEREVLQFKHLIRESCLEDLSNTFVEYMVLQNPTSSWTKDCTLFLKKMRNRVVDRDLMNLSVSLWKNIGLQRYLASMNLPMKCPIEERLDVFKDQSKNSYQSDDPAYHLLPNFDKIMSHGYEPTLKHILSLRITTTGDIFITL